MYGGVNVHEWRHAQRLEVLAFWNVSRMTWIWGTELRNSPRAVPVLNHWALFICFIFILLFLKQPNLCTNHSSLSLRPTPPIFPHSTPIHWTLLTTPARTLTIILNHETYCYFRISLDTRAKWNIILRRWQWIWVRNTLKILSVYIYFSK